MAITVRFPNGQAVRYNSAAFVEWSADGGARLLEEKDGRFIAKVLPGSGAIVEMVAPCEVSNPVSDRDAAIKVLLKGIRGVRDLYAVAELKRALHDFNATTHTWKGE